MTEVAKLVPPRGLTEQAAEAIRAMIVNGALQMGEALSEITLAKQLGTSKTPVREALLRLKLEGLVEIEPRRGTFVFRMNVAQVRQLSEMRRILEDAALASLVTGESGLLSDALAAVVSEMERAIEVSDSEQYRLLDQEFHKEIITSSRNGFLIEAYQNISFRIQALRNRLSQDLELNRASLGDHVRLVYFLRVKDLDAARILMNMHIRTTESQYISRMSDLCA